ncbi:L,D-transpeptidase [Rhodothermus profundi]|uniref:L,D-transpeptidase catalytic domain n=1 Tax=Rhodothermus profundi TaxID=633813 RepID=A0A1M6PSU1_9BACT|nr:L,D-transpeptidase [Rhodothermus profundi]SHK10966.1 L,D-transpeptidase catalytic domain [Rhodothermus profundi]
MYRGILGLLLLALALQPQMIWAQDYINQTALEDILEHQNEDLDAIPEVQYHYYILHHSSGNNVLARNTLYKVLGDGDLALGKKRARLVELLNRVLIRNLKIGDTLVIPNQFDLDFRAYSPFPRYYPGGRDFDKLFIMDKSIQAFGAYEYGKLVRWGVINTGAPENPTPNGRFNFNWKEEYRISSLSPPGEPWEMYWVFNFHDARGIHVHQYPMPTGGPASHGCVRLIDADARWVFYWADPWQTTAGGTGIESRKGKIIKQGTTVLVIGEDPVGRPRPFLFKKRYPVLKRVELPAHPYDVPPGTPQQEFFDRLRETRAGTSR